MPPTRVAPIGEGAGQFLEDAVGDEGDVDAVEHGGEPVDHAGEPGEDLGELLQRPAGAQRTGVVHDRLEPQHVFAFGVALAASTARSGL